MTGMPSTVLRANGQPIRLGKQLGQGGEGIVLEVDGQSDIAVKLYHPNKIGDRQEKITAMIRAGLARSSGFVAFPTEIVFSQAGQFVGFAMRKVGGHKPIHQLLSPASRKNEFVKANFRFLVRSAVNVARAIASVHATGCVIGDINSSGVLVSDGATVSLIDSDSFQVAEALKTFLCNVGVPEFTPPELHGRKFDHVKRTSNHDAFGLAVLVFQLLFMGRHPFSGRFQGSELMPLERSISEFRFAYSSRISDTKTKPPPNVPTLSDVPPRMAAAFEKAFGREGIAGRPSAVEWISILEQAEKELVSCATNSIHHYFKNSAACPWCKMEHAMPTFIAFAPLVTPIITSTTTDLRALIAAIDKVADPGPAPNIHQILNIGSLSPSPKVAQAKKARYLSFALSAVFAIGGVVFFQFSGGAPLVGLALIGGSLYHTFTKPKELEELVEARRLAEANWQVAQEGWARQAGNHEFLARKNEARDFINNLQDIPNLERQRMQELETKKRENQLFRHLDKCHLAKARIRGIGSGRRAMLASFGIETAADIQQHAILQIPGFGSSLAADLIAWRRSHEQKFVFNANEALNPADVQAVRRDINQRKTDAENRCRNAISKLQQTSALAVAQRRSALGAAETSFRAFKQSSLDVDSVNNGFRLPSVRSLVWLGIVAVLGIIVIANYSSKTSSNQTYQTTPKQVERDTSTYQTHTATTPSPLATDLARQAQDFLTKAPPISNINLKPELKIDLPAQETELAVNKLANKQAGDSRAPDPTEQSKSFAPATPLPPLTPPVEVRSAAAPVDLRAPTIVMPNAPTTIVPRTFAGGWAINRAQCDESDEPPLQIKQLRADVSTGHCDFKSIANIAPGSWRVDATCVVAGKSSRASVNLILSGDTLTWSSGRGTNRYVRCEK